MRNAAASPWLSRRRRARVVTAVLVLLLAGCTGDELPEVTVERVEPGEVTSTVSAPATVQPAARQDVTAGISGVVVAVEVADGKRVRADRPVLRLSSAQVDLARRQAAAAADAAVAAGVAVDGGGAATLAATAEAVADYDAKTLPRVRAARRRAKAVRNPDQRAAALAAVDAVEASYESTRAALLGSGRALAASQQATADALASALNQVLASAGAPQRLQAQAAQAAAERQADDLVVRAPFAGTVQLGQAAAAGGPELPADLAGGGLGDLAAAAGAAGALPGPGAAAEGQGTLRVGAPVTAGQTLFTVYDLRDYYVSAEVDEIDAPLVRAGQRADVAVDAFGDTAFEGVVESVDLTANRTQAGGVGYPVRIRILEPAGGERRSRLRVGMTASAEIATQTVRSDLVVPSRALLRQESGDVVYVVRDGRAHVVAVEVAALGEEQAAVRGDLRAGDEVVVTGYEDLSDGAEVRVR